MTAGEPAFDVILRGATVVDGTGAPRFLADIAIAGDRIAAVGRLEGVPSREAFDVCGLVAAPGFIDVHTHDDCALVERPEMLPKLSQGVTTVIAGNCGISAAPLPEPRSVPDLLRLVFKTDSQLRASFADYARHVEDCRPAVNCAFLVGHATLRAAVMGSDLDRAATPVEVAEMRELLSQSLNEGAIGLSSGLFYGPARAAPTEEVAGIARALYEYDGLYVTHLRDEADGVQESLDEALRIGRAADAAVVISHHKCMGRRNFGRSAQTLAQLEQAACDQPVHLDVYPYTAGSTILTPELAAMSERTVIAWSEALPGLAGMELSAAAAELGCSVIEAIDRIRPAGAIYFMMDETDVTRILRHPMAMVGSDGLPEDSHPHPRLWGTFPRVLGRYVRERRELELEDAVNRMTGLAARTFGLNGRGLLAAGEQADICVFDPLTVADRATFEAPTQQSAGIALVFVNGALAWRDGLPTGARAGRVLRRGKRVL